MLSKAVFQSGISWRVIEAKWPSTREAFHDFDVRRVAALSERDIDALAADTRVIRNRKKLEAIAGNAARMLELEAEHGSFKSTCALAAPSRRPSGHSARISSSLARPAVTSSSG